MRKGPTEYTPPPPGLSIAPDLLRALGDTFPWHGDPFPTDHPYWTEVQTACGISWDRLDILRFLDKCTWYAGVESETQACLHFNGARSRGAGNIQWYGSFWTKGKTVRAHKFSAVAILGLRPAPGEHLDHDCHHTRCISCIQVLSFEQNMKKIRRPKKADLVLAKFLNISPAEVLSLSPSRRKDYERMMAVSTQLERGEVPPGVTVCR